FAPGGNGRESIADLFHQERGQDGVGEADHPLQRPTAAGSRYPRLAAVGQDHRRDHGRGVVPEQFDRGRDPAVVRVERSFRAGVVGDLRARGLVCSCVPHYEFESCLAPAKNWNSWSGKTSRLTPSSAPTTADASIRRNRPTGGPITSATATASFTRARFAGSNTRHRCS